MIVIVIPVHNRKHLTRNCLISLRKQTLQNFIIVVIDDASTDGTGQMIQKEFPEVVLLRGDGNLWWTAAVNRGIRHALSTCNSEDYIMVLNDDIVVPTDYVATFRKLSSVFPNTLIGSVVVDINNKDVIYSGGIRINWKTAKWHNLNAGRRLSLFPKGFYVDVSTLTGRGVLIPSRVFREIGLYDDRHFVQCGDTEFPKRAEKAGYRLIVSYDAVVFSHVRAEDDINHAEKYTFSDIKDYFWSTRSHTNLRDRYWLAYKTHSSIREGSLYLAFDLARTTYHFVRRLRIL